ncbi:hypothetical protein [Sporanaerobacter sp. PP17-6a]|uniref:hypothetical protein n=1 Tax=Sporanaerobacter sp. PP17-6a TaxID=1891289 RepID=UPI00089FAECE|nr:hypothetical protein [Sporanaerobacter sp. PP17-6a]SCL85053.1 hypothetical protein PP176A_0791 [Sporanaerobacter sp. PP17-6a]
MEEIIKSSERKQLRNVFEKYFHKQSQACVSDDKQFYNKFIAEVKEQYKDIENANYKEERYRLTIKKDKITNYDCSPEVSYFALAITIMMVFIKIFYDRNKTDSFLLFTYIAVFAAILIIMFYRDNKSKKDATEIAFYNLCLHILNQIKVEESNNIRYK